MPATPARAEFVSQAFRTEKWEDPAIKAMYGKSARDTKDEVVETFFDELSAVQTRLDERSPILGGHARRFVVDVAELIDPALIDFDTDLPGALLIDDEKLANLNTVVTSVDAYDFETETTKLAVWGIV